MNKVTLQNAIWIALLMIGLGVVVALFRSVTMNTSFWDELWGIVKRAKATNSPLG